MIDLHADGGNLTRASTSPQGYYERKRLIFTTKIMEKQKKKRTVLYPTYLKLKLLCSGKMLQSLALSLPFLNGGFFAAFLA